jgi:tryptophan synthase alpha chain
MSRIITAFENLHRTGRAALMPYLTMGYPRRDSALALVPVLVEAGADLIELGIPFSDPLADGATIQATAQQALANGMTLSLCLEQAAALRRQGVEIPLVLMGYYNPIFQMGLDRFAHLATTAGIDGLIVPDLPPEEAGDLRSTLDARGIDSINLLSPTSDDERVRLVTAQTSGFAYLVSLTGVTGARDHLPAHLESFVARVRSTTDLPLAVGFGISTPAQAARVAHVADGVIVGSALLKAVGASKEPVEAARAFIASLRAGMDG